MEMINLLELVKKFSNEAGLKLNRSIINRNEVISNENTDIPYNNIRLRIIGPKLIVSTKNRNI